jgi:hypothetical protein
MMAPFRRGDDSDDSDYQRIWELVPSMHLKN